MTDREMSTDSIGFVKLGYGARCEVIAWRRVGEMKRTSDVTIVATTVPAMRQLRRSRWARRAFQRAVGLANATR